MIFDFNFYATSLLIIGLINLALSLILLNFKNKSAKGFSITFFFISIWIIGFSFELASTSLNQKILFINIKYLGYFFTPTFLFFSIVEYLNLSRFIIKFNKIILIFIPSFFLGILYTNNFHNLFFEFLFLDLTGNIPLVSYKSGLVYLVSYVYFYVCLIVIFVLLIIHFYQKPTFYKKQIALIFISILTPLFFQIVSYFGYKPFGNIGLLEFSLVFSTFFLLINLIFFKLFSISPINNKEVIESLELGILVLNSNLDIVFVNHKMVQMIGVNENSLIGFNSNKTFIFNNKIFEAINNRINRKDVFEFNNSFFEVSVSFIETPKMFYVLEFNAIEQNESIQNNLLKRIKDLEELNSLKDKLFSIIAHDLKSPFASLLSMFNMANEDNFSKEDFKVFLPKITESVEYTSTLIDNLLSWCRSQINAIDFNIERVFLKKIIDDEIIFFNNKAIEKKIKIYNEILENDFILADKNSIQLVLRNLFSNAIKFCRTNDTITISFQIKEDKGIVIFKDTGVGMTHDVVEKLFGGEIFTTYGTNNEKGTGLGLLLSKDFIEKSGGEIFVESKVNVGTSFFITFPN